MEFNITREGDIAILKAPERLELAISHKFKKALVNLVNQKFYKLIIDLSDTTFIDSNGISSLVARIYVCRSNRGDIRLSGVSQQIMDVFSITNLNKIFKIYQSLPAAVSSY